MIKEEKKIDLSSGMTLSFTCSTWDGVLGEVYSRARSVIVTFLTTPVNVFPGDIPCSLAYIKALYSLGLSIQCNIGRDTLTIDLGLWSGGNIIIFFIGSKKTLCLMRWPATLSAATVLALRGFAHIERWTRQNNGDVHWRSISKDNILTLYRKDSARGSAIPTTPATSSPG